MNSLYNLCYRFLSAYSSAQAVAKSAAEDVLQFNAEVDSIDYYAHSLSDYAFDLRTLNHVSNELERRLWAFKGASIDRATIYSCARKVDFNSFGVRSNELDWALARCFMQLLLQELRDKYWERYGKTVNW